MTYHSQRPYFWFWKLLIFRSSGFSAKVTSAFHASSKLEKLSELITFNIKDDVISHIINKAVFEGYRCELGMFTTTYIFKCLQPDCVNLKYFKHKLFALYRNLRLKQHLYTTSVCNDIEIRSLRRVLSSKALNLADKNKQNIWKKFKHLKLTFFFHS